METTKILLNSKKNKNSTNEDNFIGVDLNSYEKNIAPTEDSFNVDAYQQYFKEKDASEKYRLAFTITPFCTNVLFNVITEPVYREGADDCVVALMNSAGGGDTRPYYKPTQTLTRKNLIRDTGFSHPKACAGGGFVYHCGYDIFNNHYLRKKEYAVVASGNTEDNSYESCFNTIQDTVRDSSNNVAENFTLFQNSDGKLNSAVSDTHLYCQDTIYTYTEAVFENLIENNGWFGFLNAATLPIDNITFDNEDYSINKCMNSNKAWEQIDMYPDRSLFSFIPKINKYRNNRIEKNWDYCITYPKEIDSGHTMVTDGNGVNGIFCIISGASEISEDYNESGTITFKSSINHNLNRGDYVSISFTSKEGGSEMKTPSPVRVIGVGVNGNDPQHYFSVRTVTIPEIFFADTASGVRIRKCNGRNEAQYYLRKFYKLESLPSNSLNKLAFSQNAYSDQVAQIIFTGDIVTFGLTDYLGRPVSELYLTIVKRNKGWDKWYGTNPNFASEDIEFSHCFGEVTSGFDMPEDEEFKKYNVRRIHSIAEHVEGITDSPEKLEAGITIDDNRGWFYGDIVEFFPNKLQETTIEDVYHRFNTAQRETLNNEYSGFTYDEIKYDDFFFNQKFEIEERTLIYGSSLRINLLPEGYYYKPHYKVVVKEFSPDIQMGQHTKLAIKTAQSNGNNHEWTLTLINNYYFQEGDRVLYYGANGNIINGRCTIPNTSDRKTIRVSFDGGVSINSDSVLYRQNPTMPDYAYEIKDGSGRYIWREVMKHSDMLSDNELYNDLFTNGAHYHHKNISFYLKRQDPDGRYGIGLEPKNTASFFSVEGRKNEEVSYAEYQKEEEGNIC